MRHPGKWERSAKAVLLDIREDYYAYVMKKSKGFSAK
jgi:hypothetical protein